jgi:hypothetical protein
MKAAAKHPGFFVEQIRVFGPRLETAEIALTDGLNVIAGASDTGKSYLCSLVDFGFGASTKPRPIEAAKGYDRVVLRIRGRGSDAIHEIERSLTSGNALLRRVAADGRTIEQRTAAAKHNADDPSTLSAFLLGLSGFEAARVCKNNKGETRTLSFRDVAFLTVVDETRIISENPPHLSGNPIDRTVEGEVLRLLVTGLQAGNAIVAPKVTTAQGLKAQLEVVQQLISQTEADLSALQLDPTKVDDELARIDQARADLLKKYEATRTELVGLERQLAERARRLREDESRLVVIEGLGGRFELLDRHYASDIQRLSAVGEAGTRLEALPARSCPICGAAPEAHRPEDAAAHFRLQDVQAAAETERGKTEVLRRDLKKVLAELTAEGAGREASRSALQGEIQQLEAKIAEEVQPHAHASAEQLHQQDQRRDTVVRGRALVEQLSELRVRATQLDKASKRGKKGASSVETGVRTAEMEAFALQVQEVLAAWQFPETGRVVFSDDSQDLVIGGQDRASHGKGVRALTCAAFISALMRHCVTKQLPHPGLVVLDSPLVVYKDPDKPGSESARMRQAGVKDAFYRAMADGLCLGQVIVLENEDPAPDVAGRITHLHFTKVKTGRYGLFPVQQ